MAQADEMRPELASSRMRRAVFRTVPGRGSVLWAMLFSIVINLLVLVQPLYSTQVFNRVLTSGSIETLVGLSVLAVAGLAFYAAFDVIRGRIISRFAVRFERHIAPLVLEASIVDPARRAEGGTHDFVKLRELRNILSGRTIGMLMDAPFLPAFIVVLYLIHPLYGAIALAGGVALAILAFLSGRIAEAERKQALVTAPLAQLSLDSIVRHANLVRAMGWTSGAIREFLRLNDRALAPASRGNERIAVIAAIAHWVRMTLQIAAIGVGCWLVLHHEVLAGSMLASSIMISRTLAPVEAILGSWRSLTSAWEAWDRVALAAGSVMQARRRILLPQPMGHLDVEGITYFGSDTRRPIISNVSFRCPAGTVLVIIGPTGAGKSTILRMLAGLEQPARGAIRIDGASLDHWDPDQIGQYLGYLPQELDIFGGTVAEAIAGFSEGVQDEDIVEAARRANAHEMILSLPQGYQTELGRDGARVSGGQRQRIGLARAFFGHRRVILLDEPNSNLDPDGEEALCSAIREAKARGSTLIIVSHRPRILTVADLVLLLRDGQRIAFGPPADVVPRATTGATPIRRPESPAPAAVQAQS